MSTGINIGKSIKVLDEGSTLTSDVAQIDFTGTGVTATAVGNNVTVNVVGATGVWGIANTSGVYTFYATLTLAMAAATAGQTIELFADVTETGAVTVTLKAGVTINGNGHAYNVTNAGSFDVFESTVAGTYRIYNLIVNRTNGTGGNILNAKNYVASIHYFDGSIFTTNTAGIYSGSANVIQKFYNGNIISTSTGTSISGLQDNAFYNFNIRALSTHNTACCQAQNIYNTNIEHEGSPAVFGIVTGTTIYNSIIISRGSTACIGAYGTGYNSTFFCAAGTCTYPGYGLNFNNCNFISTGSYAVYSQEASIFRNCTFISTASYGIFGNISSTNSSIYSSANIAAYINNGVTENATIHCAWNNTGGHSFRTDSNNMVIKNSSLKVTNASANCLYAASAITTKYANNSFEGATTPVNVNITQGIINTQDNQGNILI
jgi:hypothetical protein